MKDLHNLYYTSCKIEDINFRIFSSHAGIVAIEMNTTVKVPEGVIQLQQDDPFMFNAVDQLKRYFSNDLKVFDLPLQPNGTLFQNRVWSELMKIPYGQTITYKELAIRLGSELKTRAVGRANGANPIPIIIPCHRVINTGGKLGGYSGGLKIKEKLLELEGALSLELFEN